VIDSVERSYTLRYPRLLSFSISALLIVIWQFDVLRTLPSWLGVCLPPYDSAPFCTGYVDVMVAHLMIILVIKFFVLWVLVHFLLRVVNKNIKKSSGD